jgi:DNA-binding protein HU-beta|tara:strand:- start:2826 stop:3098 length:273 start_codon:yes stop_codon:yes gene_type:complete
MNKADLVNSVASSVGIPKSKAAKAIDSVFSSITKALKSGKGVQLIGFGSFSVSKRKARVGRNPRTGQKIQIKASKVAKFKAGQALKKAVK